MKKILSLLMALTMVLCATGFSAFAEENTYVAKVGSISYTNIDDAIAAWTAGKTLTLLSDVTLTDTIKLNSTETHTLQLGTFTMTAAEGKNAIEIVPKGLRNGNYAITVDADKTNPGGITATGMSCISHEYAGFRDRPIIQIKGGVFNGKNAVYCSGASGAYAPHVWIQGGVFNASIYTNRAQLRISGGTFHKVNYIYPDTTSYTWIKAGRFLELGNNFNVPNILGTWWNFGTDHDAIDVGVYVDEEGYYVVGGDIVDELSDVNAQAYLVYTETNEPLTYSTVYQDVGKLFYQSARVALENNSKGEIVICTREDVDITTTGPLIIDASAEDAYFGGDVQLGECEDTFTVKFKESEPYTGTVTPRQGHLLDCVETKENGIVTRVYSNYVDTDEPFAFYDIRVNPGKSLAMEFVFEKEHIIGTDYYARIEHTTPDGIKETTIDYADWTEDGDYIYFTYDSISAKQMSDELNVTVYNNDGVRASKIYLGSLRKCAIDFLAKCALKPSKVIQDINDMTAYIDMLNYGAEAQKTFGYNTANLANENTTAYQHYATKSISSKVEADSEYTGTMWGSNLTLKDNILYSAYFYEVTEEMYATVSYTDHNGNVHEYEIPYSKFSPNKIYHEVIVDTLEIADADQIVTITVYNADGSKHASVSGSINGYLANAIAAYPEKGIYPATAKFINSAYVTLHD